MKKKTKIETQRAAPQPAQMVPEETTLSNYSSIITNFLNQLKLQEPELDFVNTFQELTLDISKYLHHHPSRIPLAAISASWQRLSNEILFQVQQVNSKARDTMIQQKFSAIRSSISQVHTAAPCYQIYKKEHQALYQQIKKSLSMIQQSVEFHDENRALQQLAKFKTDLSHSFSRFFQLADLDKAESAQILKQCKRDSNQIQRLLVGTNPAVVVPMEFHSFTKFVNSLKFDKKKEEKPRRSKTPPARLPNLLLSFPKPNHNMNVKSQQSNAKTKSSATNSSAAPSNASAASQIKEKYISPTRKVLVRSKTPPSRPILMKTIASAQKPRISKFSAVENYIFPKPYSFSKPTLNQGMQQPQSARGPPYLYEKDKKTPSIKPNNKRPVSPPNSKNSPNAKLNLNLNLDSLSNSNSNQNIKEIGHSNSARGKVTKSPGIVKSTSRTIKKENSKSSLSRPTSPGGKQNQPAKPRQQPQSNLVKSRQTKPVPKNPPKNQQNQRNLPNQNPSKKFKQQTDPVKNDQNKVKPDFNRNKNISRYIDDIDIDNDNDNDLYNTNSNDGYNENENETDNDNDNKKYKSQMKRTDSIQSFDSATDQLVLAMNKAKEQVRESSPTLEKLQRDLSYEGLFFDGDEPIEVTIGNLYKSFSKKLNVFDQLIVANDKINELNQKVEKNTWKDDKELEDYLSFIDENSIIVHFLTREKKTIYDTAKSIRQLNEKVDYYLNRNNYHRSLSNSNDNSFPNPNFRSNDDLTDLYATIEDQLAQINKQSSSEKERNENSKLMKKFESSKNIFYEFTEKVNEQNRMEEIKFENKSIKRRINILQSIQSFNDDLDIDNDINFNDNDNDNEDNFNILSLNENDMNEMSFEEVLSIYEYLCNNKNQIKSKYVEGQKVSKNRDKFRPSEDQLNSLTSIHQQMKNLQLALVSIENDEQKKPVNEQMLTRTEIESLIMDLINQEKIILQSLMQK